MARPDPHSYTDDRQPRTRALEWRARVNFTTRTIAAQATLILEQPGAGPLDLDTRDLSIATVQDDDGQPVPFSLAAPEPILGARLRVELPPGTQKIHIRY